MEYSASGEKWTGEGKKIHKSLGSAGIEWNFFSNFIDLLTG